MLNLIQHLLPQGIPGQARNDGNSQARNDASRHSPFSNLRLQLSSDQMPLVMYSRLTMGMM